MSTSQPMEKLIRLRREDRRRRELALALYRPTPKQRAFHEAKCSERIVRGGHRSGKSTAGALEVSHAATRIPIVCDDGTEVPYKYPTRPLRIWVIGKDEKHLGETIYTLLFKGGLFYVIDDVETGQPRIWNPNLPEDVERKAKRRTSGPMIPATEIESLSYSDKSLNAVSRCVLKNGTEISFYPSGGNCPSGVPVDLLWIDEDIVYPEYVADWQGRLIDRGGRLIWTAFPWAQNDALMNLSQRAIEAEETGVENPDIREFRLSMSENPYLDPEETRKARERWAAAGDIVLAARDRGEFPMDAVLMYPEFNRNTHGIDESRCPDSVAARILQDRNGEPPDDWMRLLALDPGSRKAAVLFATIPPPDIGDEMIIYDEIFQFNSDARALAREVQIRTHGRVFHKFIIDGHAARITPTGLGRNIRSVYLDAFREKHIENEGGNTSFIDGNDNVRWRTEQVRQYLRTINRETPQLLFWLPKMRRTLEEFGKYKRRLRQKEYDDEPIPANNDAMNCLEYLVGSCIGYHVPKPRKGQSPAVRGLAYLNRKFGRDRRQSAGVVMGTGG